MKNIFYALLLVLSFLNLTSLKLPGIDTDSKKSTKAIYNNLDSRSVVQHFAFYELYPDTQEGKMALKKAWKLLNQEDKKDFVYLPSLDVNLMIALVNKQSSVPPEELTEEKLQFIESLGKNLKNRKLKGHKIEATQELVKLKVNEVDLSRALFLEEVGDSQDSLYKLRYYEACLDLMALQILAKLPENAKALDIIETINDYIFYEMGFKFPPQSLHAKDIDTYTFLPSVMDSRRGVCLGVSILYLSLAQRLGLNLEIVTPPGHIYIRHNNNGKITNIETTARGVDYPSEVYLSIETKKLQMRNIKEVIGLAFFNQASVFWGRENHEMAISLYEKAKKYIPKDKLLQEFLGLNMLFVGREKEARILLEDVKNHLPDYSTSKDTIVEDYLNKKTDIKSMKAIFKGVDSSRKSIIEKQEELKKVVKKYPQFRAGLMQLASTYLQLGREKEALVYLNDLYKIDPNDPTLNYYLSIICYERYDYLNAWKYYKNTKKILDKHNHKPRALKELYMALKAKCPEHALN